MKTWLIVLALALALVAGLDYALVRLNLFPIRKPIGNTSIGFGLEVRDPADDLRMPTGPHINSRGFKTRRTVAEILNSPRAVPIAVVGDSHTDLDIKQVPREFSHPFVMEAELNREAGEFEVLDGSVGRYSPLQEYLLFRNYLKEDFKPKILVMNLYTGNDFYDLLRVDDRPHFSQRDGASVIEPPVWIIYRDPSTHSWGGESRVLGAVNLLLARHGQSGLLTRGQVLYQAAVKENAGVLTVLRYFNDIRKSVEPRIAYRAAFSAQILNQALYMKKYFPDSTKASKQMFSRLLGMVRQENPGLRLILCAIPSAALAERIPDPALYGEVLERVGLSGKEVASFEKDLYEFAKSAAREQGWQFVDILPLFEQEHRPLYSELDLHLNVLASMIIGRAQARAVAPTMPDIAGDQTQERKSGRAVR